MEVVAGRRVVVDVGFTIMTSMMYWAWTYFVPDLTVSIQLRRVVDGVDLHFTLVGYLAGHSDRPRASSWLRYEKLPCGWPTLRSLAAAPT